jgi:hypothetical protein
VNEPPELGHPGVPFVPDIPQQPERAAGGQDPCDLRHGPHRVDPMPRLGDENGIYRAVFQRNLLGGAGQRAGARQDPGQLPPHAFRRFDRHDIQATFHQLAGELAGAGPQIENAAGTRWQQPVQCLGRIGRPSPFVFGRRGSE